ncbi:thioredoxin family protein [Streptomyces sp. NPDC002623]
MQRVSPALEQVACGLAGPIKLVKVDVHQSCPLARRFEVQMVPTQPVLHNGQVIARQAGAAPADVLRPWAEKLLPGRRPGPPPQGARGPSRPACAGSPAAHDIQGSGTASRP